MTGNFYKDFLAKMKHIVVTFRFSIISIFISLFIVYSIAILWITSHRFSLTVSYTAFNLMEEVSDSLFGKINSEIQRISSINELSANLLKSNIIPRDNLYTIMQYTFYLLEQEKKLHSGSTVEGMAWSDAQGNYVWSQRRSNNTIRSEIIDRMHGAVRATYYHRNEDGEIIKEEGSKSPMDLDYDARTRPWYIKALHFGKTSLTDVGQYLDSKLFGMSVLTPVFSNSGQPEGVFETDIQLLFLKTYIENLTVSKNGLIFILGSKGDVLAFPKMIPYRGSSLLKIKDIPYPWVVKSFDEYEQIEKSKFTFKYEGNRYLAVYKRVYRPEAKNDLIIGVVAPEDDFLGDLNRLYLFSLIFSFLIFLVGLIIISYLITKLVKPLKKIIHEIEKVQNFDLSGNTRIQSHILEVTAISETVQAMKVGLRSFQKYVPIPLVQQLIKLGKDAHLGGVKKPLVVFFSDIVKFTTLAENEDPERLTQHLCQYFSELVRIIEEEQGTIDKYIGDSIMAFWGAPIEQVSAPKLGAIAALRCKQKLLELNNLWEQEKKPVFHTRFGVHMGNVIVGNIGSENRINYTAIGDVVNHASRLENANNRYGTQIIVSEAMYSELKDQLVFRFLDRVRLKGRQAVENIYELLAANRAEISFDLESYVEHFKAGFAFYEKQKWTEAVSFFEKCIAIYPDDTVAPVFISRCKEFSLNSPNSDWDGVYDTWV